MILQNNATNRQNGCKIIVKNLDNPYNTRILTIFKVASFLSTHLKTKSTSQEVLFVLKRCVPLARNVMRTACVMLPLAVMCASRVSKEHITSLCAKGAIHHYGEAITSLRRSRYITLYKRSKLCYNITESEVLLCQIQNYANYQWSFPLIS